MNYKLLIAAFALLSIFSCGVSEDIENIQDELAKLNFSVSTYNDQVGIYDTLTIRGSFSEDLPAPTINISGTNDYTLDFISASTSEIIAFIPVNVEAGNYELSFTVDGETITENLAGEVMNITMQDRPLVTNISSKSFAAGTEITVSGGSFINTSGNESYKPTVWFMATGYTNTVSEITVNEAGDQASIIVDADIPAGEYTFHITADQDSQYYTQWSNELTVTVL